MHNMDTNVPVGESFVDSCYINSKFGHTCIFARRNWKSLTTTSYKVSQGSNKIGSISPGMSDPDPPPALEPLAQAIFAFWLLACCWRLRMNRSLEDVLHQLSSVVIMITSRQIYVVGVGWFNLTRQ